MKFPPIGVVPEPSATRFLRFVERLLHCPPIGDERAMYPYVALRAPHTTKIHTLITLGISIRRKLLVLWFRQHLPFGFDSHRPLHF